VGDIWPKIMQTELQMAVTAAFQCWTGYISSPLLYSSVRICITFIISTENKLKALE